MMRRFPGAIALIFILSVLAYSQTDVRNLEEFRRNTVRFGTDAEILDLIRQLVSENASYLDGDLRTVAEETTNGRILAGIFDFFSNRDVTGLEHRGVELILDRDWVSGEALTAAIGYLGVRKAMGAVDPLKDILEAEEEAFSGAAVRALGRIGSAMDKDGADDMAEYFMAYYRDREPTDEVQREIIIALGELRSELGVSFLAVVAEDGDERPFRRIAALEALKKIGHEDGLDAVVVALGAQDANVRAAAVGALGPFRDKKADVAILEAFRDSFYKSRIAAATAAGERKLSAAVPYLRHRAERDSVAAVRDGAIRALGAIADRSSRDALSSLFLERKNSDRVRALAAEQLIAIDAPAYAETVIAELDEAKAKKRNALYGSLAKTLSTALTHKVRDLTVRFLTQGDVIEKMYGITMASKNGFRDLEYLIRPLTNDRNAALSRRAREALETLGF